MTTQHFRPTNDQPFRLQDGPRQGGDGETPDAHPPSGVQPNADTEPEGGVPLLSHAEWSPQDPRLGEPPLPPRFTRFRTGQWEAANQIVEHLRDPNIKVVMLSAPTGSGKTLIGDVVRRRYAPSSTIYTCTTKTLQDQIVRDFPYAKSLKGRNNYPTLNFPETVTADSCSISEGKCPWCETVSQCPYQVAKREAKAAPLPVFNTAYLLNTFAFVDDFRGRNLVVIDEADTLEAEIMRHVQIEIPKHMQRRYRITPPEKKTVKESWHKWAVKTMRILKAAESRLTISVSRKPDPKQVKQLRRVSSTLRQVEQLLTPTVYRDGPDGLTGTGPAVFQDWVYTGYETGDIVFKPVVVDKIARRVLWKHAHKFLLMSATLVAPQQVAEDLGLRDGEWAVVQMDSVFPVERRPVFLKPKANMTYKTKDTAYPKMVAAIQQIIDDNPGKRILVHTVSYDLTQHLRNHLAPDGRIVTYWSSKERERALRDFLAQHDAVLLAPSFDRGVDLPGEDCQIIIIAKVPYPALGDKQVSARMYGYGQAGKTWYATETIRTICQMTGRGMRSADDLCDSYILDAQFMRLWHNNNTLFPRWWREAVVIDEHNPKWQAKRRSVQ